MAEYEARVLGLRAAIERNIKEIQVFGDSSIVIYQLRGEWEMRDSKLIKYHDLIQELKQKFNKVSFNYLPREENRMADALDTLAAAFEANIGGEMRPIEMQSLEVPAHCCNLEEEANTTCSITTFYSTSNFKATLKGQMKMIRGPSEGWRLATYWMEKSCTKGEMTMCF
ncbi:hypothetical protein V6N13_082085 [Hibiscus sabdariffa]